MALPEYRVTVTREDDLWVAIARDLPDGMVGAADFEHFADVGEAMLRLEPGEFTVVWEYDFGGNTTETVREYLDAQRSAQTAGDRRDEARANVVKELHGRLCRRAIADLLGLSHQRVNQLINS